MFSYETVAQQVQAESGQAFTAEQMQEMFEYLDELRESGETNMFGARPYVERQFGLDKKVAGKVLAKWMETFGDRKGDKA